jgi:GAF domain-containing protein
MSDDPDLSWLAPTLLEEATLADRVESLVTVTARLLRGATVGVVLVRRGVRVDAGPTDPVLASLSDVQERGGAGPDLDLLAGLDLVVVDDIRGDDRWPAWADRAGRSGLRSMAAVRLRARTTTLGILTCYATRPRHFAPEDVSTLRLISRRATPAVATAGERARLWDAVDARRTIGMAEGVLMEAYGICGEDAADVLTSHSRDRLLTRLGLAGRLVGHMAAPG